MMKSGLISNNEVLIYINTINLSSTKLILKQNKSIPINLKRNLDTVKPISG